MTDWRAERMMEGKRRSEEKEKEKKEEELKKVLDLVERAVERAREKDRGEDAWLVVRADAKFDEPDEVPNEKV